ncbi:ParB/RepB/Spo0J family partition protein [Nitrospirillum iridis]|uniref:ParB/RepB/Spo0J family partition protein n=1 Tax=Nitrospirillum iridis TaxID=765888 RepID=A0A7X0AWI3_9PROT|nr:ParB/RepB/Spo0J family partition protein [Nitrospirillum iridis]MBB6251404.1 ParB/RepB/Spo0J family partition protein [Nitrospirillum iridis]
MTAEISQLGQRLKAAMDAKGLGIRPLARAAGLASHASIGAVLRGATPGLDLDTLRKLAPVLDVTLGHLTGDADLASPGAAGAEEPDSGVRMIPLDRLMPSALNPRKVFDVDALEELADSMAAQGQLQNLTARPHPDSVGYFEVFIGGRRLRAATILVERGTWPGDHAMKVDIRPATDKDVLAIAAMENIDRKDMHPLEEGQAFLDMLAAGWTKDEIGRMFKGRTPRWVELRMQMARDLTEAVKDLWLDGDGVNLEMARELMRLPADQQEYHAMRIGMGADGYATAVDLRDRIAEHAAAMAPQLPMVEPGGLLDALGLGHPQPTTLGANAPERPPFLQAMRDLREDLVQRHAYAKPDPAPTTPAFQRGDVQMAAAPVLPGPSLMSPQHRDYVDRVKTQALQMTVFAHTRMAMVLACVGMMGNDPAILLRSGSPGSRRAVHPTLAEALESQRTHRSTLTAAMAPVRAEAEDGRVARSDAAADLVRALLDLPDSDLRVLFAALVAARVYAGGNVAGGDSPAAVAAWAADMPRMADQWQIDTHYLSLLDAHRLRRLAVTIGMTQGGRHHRFTSPIAVADLKKWDAGKLRSAIADFVDANDVRTIPAEFRFGTYDEIAAAMAAEADAADAVLKGGA